MISELEAQQIAMRHPDLFARGGALVHGGHRPAYSDVTLSDEATGDELDLGDVVAAARREVASYNPLLDISDVDAMVLSLTGGERDAKSQAPALVFLAQQTPSRLQQLAVELAAECSCWWCSGMIGLAALTEAQRQKGSAHTIPGTTDFPIPDAKHLGVAKSFYHQGKLAGHSKATVKAHINAAAKRLGLPGLDDEDGDEDAVKDVRSRHDMTGELPQVNGHPEGPRPRKRTIRSRRETKDHGSAEDAYPGSSVGSDSASGPSADLTVALAADDLVGAYVELGAKVNRTPGAFGSGHAAGPPFPVHQVSRDDTETVDVDAALAQLVRDHPHVLADKPISGNRRNRRRGDDPPLRGTGPRDPYGR